MSNKETVNQSIDLDGYYVCQGCGKIIKENNICKVPLVICTLKNSMGKYIISNVTQCHNCVLSKCIHLWYPEHIDIHKSVLNLTSECINKILSELSEIDRMELLCIITNFKRDRGKP